MVGVFAFFCGDREWVGDRGDLGHLLNQHFSRLHEWPLKGLVDKNETEMFTITGTTPVYLE